MSGKEMTCNWQVNQLNRCSLERRQSEVFFGTTRPDRRAVRLSLLMWPQLSTEHLGRSPLGATVAEEDIARVVKDLGLEPEVMHLIHKAVQGHTAYNDLGASAVQQALVRESLEDTHTISGQECIATTRGTRPGDAWADLIFNILFTQILKKIHVDLEKQGLTISLECFHTTWADDIAVLLQFENALVIEKQLPQATYTVVQALREHGLQVSLGKHKTAALVLPRNKGAVHVKRHLFREEEATIPVLLEDDTVQLPLVPAYKHLSGWINAKVNISMEIKHRQGKAKAAYGRAAHRAFRNAQIPLGTRLQIFNATVMATFLWGAGASPPFSCKEKGQFDVALRGLYKLILPRQEGGNKYSWRKIRRLLQCATADDMLNLARFRHFGAMLTH